MLLFGPPPGTEIGREGGDRIGDLACEVAAERRHVHAGLGDILTSDAVPKVSDFMNNPSNTTLLPATKGHLNRGGMMPFWQVIRNASMPRDPHSLAPPPQGLRARSSAPGLQVQSDARGHGILTPWCRGRTLSSAQLLDQSLSKSSQVFMPCLIPFQLPDPLLTGLTP